MNISYSDLFWKTIIIFAAVAGFLSVGAGAAADHLVRALADDRAMHIVETAVRYHQLYSVVLFTIGLYGSQRPSRLLALSAGAFASGVIIFCGSLYASVFLDLPMLTAGTPIGGFLLMAGWLLAAASFLRR